MGMLENQNEAGLSSEMRDFINTILYKNRYFIDHPVVKRLEKHLNLVDKEPLILFRHLIPKDTILYRARICDDNFLLANKSKINNVIFGGLGPLVVINNKEPSPDGFNGYDALNSSVPQNQDAITGGRANASYIRFLYAAKDKCTALVEVRPTLESYVSIAQIKVEENLCLLAIDPHRLDPKSRKLNIGDYYYSQIERDFFNDFKFGWDLEALFSKPSSGDSKDYLPSQYITEYIKSFSTEKGKFDGIEFRSSLNRNGINYTIFNYQKCAPISSELYKVGSIEYCGYGADPSNTNKKLTSKSFNP